MQADQTQPHGDIAYYDWEGSDYDALIYLKSKGIEEVDWTGFLSPPYWPFPEDPKTSAAINYLCFEWDFAYGERKKGANLGLNALST